MFFTYGVRNLAGEIAQEYAKRQVRHLANLNAHTTAFCVPFFFLVLFAIANLVCCCAYT